MLIFFWLFLLLHSENLRMPQPLHIFEDSAAKSGIFCLFYRFSLGRRRELNFFVFFSAKTPIFLEVSRKWRR